MHDGYRFFHRRGYVRVGGAGACAESEAAAIHETGHGVELAGHIEEELSASGSRARHSLCSWLSRRAMGVGLSACAVAMAVHWSRSWGSAVSIRVLAVQKAPSRGIGCANWIHIRVGHSRQLTREHCEETCRLHPLGCTSYNYQSGDCPEDTMRSSPSTLCYLYDGYCEQERSACWDLYFITKNETEPVPAPPFSLLHTGVTCEPGSPSYGPQSVEECAQTTARFGCQHFAHATRGNGNCMCCDDGHGVKHDADLNIYSRSGANRSAPHSAPRDAHNGSADPEGEGTTSVASYSLLRVGRNCEPASPWHGLQSVAECAQTAAHFGCRRFVHVTRGDGNCKCCDDGYAISDAPDSDMYTLTQGDDEVTAHFHPPRCMLTCASTDGIGHQMESKLTCLGAAYALGMEYIHQEMTSAEHGSSADKFEAFFSLATFARVFEGTTMEVKERPHSSCGTGTQWCSADGRTVFSNDNCNDMFYCPRVMERWYSVVPSVQHAYYSTPKPDPDWLSGFKHKRWGSRVAIHIRRGDTLYPVGWQYYVDTIQKLRVELAAAGRDPPLFRVQTDATRAELLEEALEFSAADVVIDDISTPLELALHRMIEADMLVLSPSSLSVTAALIGNHSRVLAPCLVGRTEPPSAPILHWEKDC